MSAAEGRISGAGAVGLATFYIVVVCSCCYRVVASSAADCKDHLFGDCLKAFSSRHSPDQFIYQKEEREAACGDLERFVSCFEATGCQKLDGVHPVYEGLKNAVNFTCTEENHQHEQVATCLSWNGFRAAQEFCNEMFGNHSASPNCEEGSQAISCVIRSVDKCCGKETAVYAKKAATLMMTPIYEMLNCKLNVDHDVSPIDVCSSSSSSDAAASGPNVGLIVVIVFVIVIIIVVIVVVIIVRKSGSRQWMSM